MGGRSRSRFTSNDTMDSAASHEDIVDRQRKLGPQSRRGNAPQDQLSVLSTSSHAKDCFRVLAQYEVCHCGEWAVFYHAYSFAAVIYELHAAIAASLFRFPSQQSTLPRILVHEFARFPDAPALVEHFNTTYASDMRDHHPDYRKVAISTMCSLVALGPEASTPVVFLAGYSEKDVFFKGVLEKVIESVHVPKRKVKKLATDIVALSERHGLDVSQFGGQPCESRRAGHLLQIFIRRDLVDQLAYAALPYGYVDQARHPISEWLDGDNNTNFGQARIVAHPLWLMQRDCVKMHVVSADPRFHHNRGQFQAELTELTGLYLNEPALRDDVSRGIFGGDVPDGIPYDREPPALNMATAAQLNIPAAAQSGAAKPAESRRFSAAFGMFGFGKKR